MVQGRKYQFRNHSGFETSVVAALLAVEPGGHGQRALFAVDAEPGTDVMLFKIVS
jgi:hypothetical protein